MIRLINAEAWDWLNDIDGRVWNMVFMDPPDNLGLQYSGLPIGYDKRSEGSYYSWLWGIFFEILVKTPIIWASYYHKHDFKIKEMVGKLLRRMKPSWEARTFIWRFKFGQYDSKNCASGYRPILRLNSPAVVWNTDAVRVESVRQMMGDSRAAGLRVPDDVFEFPRVVGNSKERRAWCPTQHPEALVERILKLSLHKGVDNRVLELFTGSGTTIRVVKKMIREGWKIDLDTVELSEDHIRWLVSEHPEIQVVRRWGQ